MRAFVLLVIFVSFFDLFTQLPIISPYAKSLGASPFLIGLTVGMYSFANTIANIASGILTDRNGAKRILLIGLLATALSLFSYVFATHPFSLLVVRFIHGLTAGLIVPSAFTLLANIGTREQKGKNAAVSGAFVGSAAILGPAFSGIVANRVGELVVFSSVATLMLFLGLFSYLFLRDINIETETKQAEKLIFNDRLYKAFAGAFFLMFAQGALAYLLPLKTIELGGTTATSGLLLSTFGIIAVLLFALPTNRVFDQLNPLNGLAFGMIAIGLSLIAIGSMTTLAPMFLLMGGYGVGFAFLFPSLHSLLIDATSEKNRGKAYGYFYAFFSIGVIAGSSITGWISKTINSGFILTGVIVISASIAIRFIHKKIERG